MPTTNFTKAVRVLFTLMLAILSFSACSPHPVRIQASNVQALKVRQAIGTGGKLAEDSFYACMLSYYRQGMSVKDALNLCGEKLLEDQAKGFGGSASPTLPGEGDAFDPSSVKATCSQGDSRRAGDRNSATMSVWGVYTWGSGFVTHDARGWGVGAGLSQQESFLRKEAAVKEADKDLTEFRKALDEESAAHKELKEAQKSGDQAKIKAAQEKYDKAKEKANKATDKALKSNKKADEDPNNGGVLRTAGEPSACERAIENARETLRECHRTNWRSFKCQSLLAKMNHCPDPALIYVDPNSGYSCGEKIIDAEAVKEAWINQCLERVEYGPDGENPCMKIEISDSGRYIKGGSTRRADVRRDGARNV